MQLLEIYWFWSALILLFVFIPLTLLWIYALIDLVMNPAVAVIAKVLWLFVIIIVPLFGALVYLLFRPSPGPSIMVASTAASPGAADQLAKADELRKSGTISEEEYSRLKGKLLA